MAIILSNKQANRYSLSTMKAFMRIAGFLAFLAVNAGYASFTDSSCRLQTALS